MSADKDGGRGLREVMTTGRIVVLVLTVLALVFIFQNTRHVRIRLLGPEVGAPLWQALLATFVIGALFGWYLRWSGGRRGRR